MADEAAETKGQELSLDVTSLADKTNDMPLAVNGNDRQIAASRITETLPASAYAGAGTLQLTPEQEAMLDEATPDDEIDIRPDGLIYASHEYVRRKLNRVFGRLQWALVPGSPLVKQEEELFQRWVLLVQGTYVSEALASKKYYANGNQSYDDVAEAIKSDALRRCCKDLGIAHECWNRRKGEEWRRQYGVKVLVSTNKGNVEQWRRKDGDPLRGEIQPSGKPPTEEKKLTLKPDAPQPKVEEKPTAPAMKPAPTKPEAPKSQPQAATQQSNVVRLTEGQIRLLWVRAGQAGLVQGDNADPWVEFMASKCLITIPPREGKTSKDTANTMMRLLSGGQQFQKILQALAKLATKSGEVQV